MSDTRGKRLRAARSRRFASARAAAIALAVPISTYGAHERAESSGGRDYGPDEAQRYAAFFAVTPEWLLTGYNKDYFPGMPSSDAASAKLPIAGYIGKNAQAHFFAVSPENLDRIPAPRLVTPSAVALEIRGNSMGSHLNRWLVIYDDTHQPPSTDLMGKLCVVALHGGQVLIKQLQEGGARGIFDLISPAADPIRDAGILWAVNVKAIIQRTSTAIDQQNVAQ